VLPAFTVGAMTVGGGLVGVGAGGAVGSGVGVGAGGGGSVWPESGRSARAIVIDNDVPRITAERTAATARRMTELYRPRGSGASSRVVHLDKVRRSWTGEAPPPYAYGLQRVSWPPVRRA